MNYYFYLVYTFYLIYKTFVYGFFSLLALDSYESDEEFYDSNEAPSENPDFLATQNSPGSITTETSLSDSIKIT